MSVRVAAAQDDAWRDRASLAGGPHLSDFINIWVETAVDNLEPAIAYNSLHEEYLVVYQNTWGASGQDIDGERVRASDGTALGWVNIAAGAGFRSFPDVASCAASNFYLIAYTFQPNSAADPGDVLGKVTSWNMGYISPEIPICDDANDQGQVAVAASENEYLAVWEDSASATTTEVYARRLGDDGTLLGPGGGFWIAGAPGRHDGVPSVAHGSGVGYLVVWQRVISTWNFDVFGRYAMPGLDIGVGSEFAFDDDNIAQMYPAVACATNGDCLMAEEDNNSLSGDFEIRGRLAMVHIFSDGFESGNLTAWSVAVP